MREPTPAPRAAEGRDDLADCLVLRWRQGGRPDVDAFLAEAGPLAPAEVAAVLRVDQRERWQAGERVPAEDYLRRHPEVRADPEAAVDLIFNEFLLREGLGERPEPQEYLRRFPACANVLRAQIELHRAMKTGAVSTPRGEASGKPTTPDRGDGAPADGPAGRLQVALVPGAGPQATHEVQALLRKRLRFFALVMLGALAIYLLVLLLPAMLAAGTIVPRMVANFGVYCAAFALWAVLAWILWSRRPLSLGQLRLIELILFGCCVATVVEWHYGFFAQFWVSGAHPALLAAGESLPWVFLIMAYGTFIPNTWRRCAGFVGIMAVIPLVLSAVSRLASGAVDSRQLVEFFIIMGTWLALAVAIAVYGSHRIEVLRQQASEARKLGPYRLKQRLGSGGMGEVYLAEHALLRRPCAVKLIRPERAGDPQHLHRFEREVQAMAALTHPNTVEVFDYGHAADGTFYYVMEYLPGLTLEQLVTRHGPLPPGRVVHLLRQVCAALAEAHAAGLVHRDVKPANVLVCARGGKHDVAKLLDFGLVQTHALADGGAEPTRLTQVGAIAGTPAYMSPEQAAGKADLDARSDVYSVGAVAYFLLTGAPPFVRGSAVQTLAAHLGEALVPPSQISPGLPADLEAVVLRCLAKDPAERFADAAALERALAACACAEEWSWGQAAAWWQARAAGEEGRHA